MSCCIRKIFQEQTEEENRDKKKMELQQEIQSEAEEGTSSEADNVTDEEKFQKARRRGGMPLPLLSENRSVFRWGDHRMCTDFSERSDADMSGGMAAWQK